MVISSKKYKLIEPLANNAALHCAALGIYEDTILERNGVRRLATVLDVLRNGTITFVKTRGKTYGITCWHVIEELMEYTSRSGNQYSHSFYLMVNGFNCVVNTFQKVKSKGINTEIDIAIREINPALLSAIEKEAIDLDRKIESTNIQYGYAVGFPEIMRYKKAVDEGFVISMPQCEILAEIDGLPTSRFTLQNDFEKVPKITDFSGMSGGPVFWCDGENYGLYGIAYEAGTGGDLTGDKGIFVYCEYATPSEIKDWISQIK